MLIDQDKCIGCRKCVPYCTAGAIYIEGKKAKINLDECVECGVCYRVKVCPSDAFYQQPLEWPRSVRAIYSDPLNIHKETASPAGEPKKSRPMMSPDVSNPVISVSPSKWEDPGSVPGCGNLRKCPLPS